MLVHKYKGDDVPFNPEKAIDEAEKYLKNTIGTQSALIALSGGVDSFTAAALAARTLPHFHAFFIDTGLMRKNEKQNVIDAAKKAKIPLDVIDAKKEFLAALKGVTDPESKRKKIGALFIELFEKEAKKIHATYLIQGTIAPDWIESGGLGRETIKSHHNVGGLPEKMHLKLCEPLREWYKHEVRLVAKTLGLPSFVYARQPFPGPALAVRIIGEITEEKIEIVREATAITEEELEKASEKNEIELPWQYFAALLDSKAVGVRGDERSYQYIVVIRAVRSLDGMTANFSQIKWDVLQRISTRITNEIRTVGRVVYDITNKPPGTIELE